MSTTMWSCRTHNIDSVYIFDKLQPGLCRSYGIDDTLTLVSPVNINTDIKHKSKVKIKT